MNTLTLRWSKLDLGLRIAGVFAAALVALWGAVMIVRAPDRLGSTVGAGIALIAGLIVVAGGRWVVRASRERIEIEDRGLAFFPAARYLTWEEISGVRSDAAAEAMIVTDRAGVEAGRIPFARSGSVEATARIFNALGPRAPRSERTGYAVEGARPWKAMLPMLVIALLPEADRLLSGRHGRWDWVLSPLVLIMVGVAFYRGSGARRLEITPTGFAWSTRRGQEAFTWSQILCLGLSGEDSGRGSRPVLLLLLRDGAWATFSLDGLDLVEVTALLHAHAPALWAGGFLSGKTFRAKAKELAAANGVALKTLRGATG